MADFCITAVRYNDDHSHITYVRVREYKGASLGASRTVSRAFIADLIRLQKVTFETLTEGANGKWRLGAPVHLFEDVYLTTDKNSTIRDNLGELPEF